MFNPNKASPNPPPLTVAASLVAVEGLVVLCLAAVALLDRAGDSLEIGAPVAVFAVLYGALLLAAAWSLTRRQAWARGPVLFTQLVLLGVAWQLWQAGTGFLSAMALVCAVVTLIGVVHPSSVEALSGDYEGPQEGP